MCHAIGIAGNQVDACTKQAWYSHVTFGNTSRTQRCEMVGWGRAIRLAMSNNLCLCAHNTPYYEIQHAFSMYRHID